MKTVFVPLLLYTVALTTACTTSTQAVRLMPDPSLFQKSELNFIRAGETTRDEVLFRLGNPSARFENDRVLIYQVGFEGSGKAHIYAPRLFVSGQYPPMRDWERGTFSLVLVFAADGLLLKHSLVPSE